MTQPKFDQDFWEQLWSKTLREHADKLTRRTPNAHLTAAAANLPPGRALDAGCGQGTDTLWLAAQGWQVTAVDFSAAALAYGRSMAEAAGAEVAERIDWVESDLATWAAEPERYDLVVCLYVHVAGAVEDMVGRMGNGVAPGGTLFLVGHARSIPALELPRLRQARCRSPSRARWLRSIPMCGRWSLQRSVCAPSPAPVSMQ